MGGMRRRSVWPITGLPLLVIVVTAGAETGGWAVSGPASHPARPEIRALLAPRVKSTLSSQIPGRITEISVSDGERFARNQPLIRFDCAILQAELNKAKAQLRAARLTYDANLRLEQQDAVGHLEVAISETDVERAHAHAKLMGVRVGMCEVRAPFPGRVVKVHVDPFQSVREGEPLIEILDDANLKIDLIVPSRWLRWLSPGTRFTVGIDETGKEYPAKVTVLGAKVDAVSQTLAITAEVQGHHDELLSGMSGVAHFDVSRQASNSPPFPKD